MLNGSPDGQGSGSSKKRAEQAAAEAAIESYFRTSFEKKRTTVVSKLLTAVVSLFCPEFLHEVYGKPDDKPERQRANPAEPRAGKRQHAKTECLDRICVQRVIQTFRQRADEIIKRRQQRADDDADINRAVVPIESSNSASSTSAMASGYRNIRTGTGRR